MMHNKPLSLPGLRNFVLIATIFGYLLMNYGFMQLRIPPAGGKGVPIGELVLLLVFVSTNWGQVFSKLSKVIFLLPFLFWWGFGIGSALTAVSEYGMWALRDATHVIESLFLVAGFVWAARERQVEILFASLSKFLLIAIVYALGFPIAEKLQAFSPKIIAGAGQSVPIVFTYTNTSILLLVACAFFLLSDARKELGEGKSFLLVAFLIAYTVMLFQGRTIYLQVIAVGLLLFFCRRKVFGKLGIAVTILFVFLILMPFLGWEFRGRIGEVVSLDFLIHHFMAIGGIENEGVEGAAYGVFQRLDWWTILYYKWISSWKTMLFGLGFGFPLIDFGLFGGVAAREPHNSYISILARMGLAGGVLFVWCHLLLLNVWRKAYRLCAEKGLGEWQNRLLVLLVYFLLIWVLALGEDGFEKPYNTIPYYFFWGVVLRFFWHLKSGVFDVEGLQNEDSSCP